MGITATIIALVIIFIILITLIFSKKIGEFKIFKWVYRGFLHLPPSDGMFQIAWDGFLFFAGILFALYSINTHRMGNIMISIWAILGFLLLFALLVSIRIIIQNKIIKKQLPDTRLDTLITKVDTLNGNFVTLANSLNTLINEIKKDRDERTTPKK